MIKLSRIYNETDSGRQIIEHYYPDSIESFVDTNRKFKARLGEKTASAMVKLYPYEDGMVWKVIDFGDDGRALSPVDISMKEDGIDNFYEAVIKIAQIFNVKDELDRSINKPDFSERPASQDEKEGQTVFQLKESIPPEHLRILGPNVTQEIAEALHWYECEYYGYVRNRKVVLRHSNENYPIFMRECLVEEAHGDQPEVKFYKVYEPLNPEKQYRFNYTPKGVKPADYINGLNELKKLYREYNAAEEAKAKKENEDAAYREKKLDEVFICSGERDALCCKSVGYPPIWFNSETYRLSDAQYREIMKYTNRLYNIPDIDATGIKKGREFALRFNEVYTMWLPESLSAYKDNRGKSRKDLRDWMEIHRSVADFKDLMNIAKTARFWVMSQNKKTGSMEPRIDTVNLIYFLSLNGFAVLHDENNSDTVFVRIEGSIVSKVRAKGIRRFIIDYANDNHLEHSVRNLLLTSTRLSDAVLENLPEVNPDFTNYTSNTQLFYFDRTTVEVTPSGIYDHKSTEYDTNRYVWAENVHPHRYRKLPPMFKITRDKDEYGHDTFDIDICGAVRSCVMGYVINSSRIYWRKELEENFLDKDASERGAYRAAHKFDIAGEGLTEEEIAEQKQNLVNKIFAIGYMLHRFKSPSRPWAPQAMDNKIGADGECNGRSGKSFLFQALAQFSKLVKLSGRNPRLMENPHVFDQISKHTDFVLVDDCSPRLDLEPFYDIITSDLTVNPKNNQSFNIPFSESPKFGFTTNYVPQSFSSSTEGRLLYMVYSDYYHVATEENDYLETRSIRDDFGRDLFGVSYTEDDWNEDINFFMQCCQFYLSLCEENVKILPPMDNIIYRKHKADMGEVFQEWAEVYFAEDGDNVNTLVCRKTAFEDYQKTTNAGKNATVNRFTKRLKAFCEVCDWIQELNPPEYLNASGRIIKRTPEGPVQEYIYLRTKKAYINEKVINENKHQDYGTFIPDEVSATPAF